MLTAPAAAPCRTAFPLEYPGHYLGTPAECSRCLRSQQAALHMRGTRSMPRDRRHARSMRAFKSHRGRPCAGQSVVHLRAPNLQVQLQGFRGLGAGRQGASPAHAATQQPGWAGYRTHGRWREVPHRKCPAAEVAPSAWPSLLSIQRVTGSGGRRKGRGGRLPAAPAGRRCSPYRQLLQRALVVGLLPRGSADSAWSPGSTSSAYTAY